MIQNDESVNCLTVLHQERLDMQDKKLTPDMVPVIKLARQKKVPYSRIAWYFGGLNFGRIAEVMAGDRYPDIPPASALPSDFPSA